jgi:PAS domain S-box-containing protein
MPPGPESDPDEIQHLRAELASLRTRLADQQSEFEQAQATLVQSMAESQALYETSLDIAAQLDLPSTLTAITQRAVALLDADGGGVYLRDEASGDLVLAAELNIIPTQLGKHIPPGDGAVGRVLKTGQPIFVNDYLTWPDRIKDYDSHRFHAVASTPFLWKGEVVGALSVFRSRPGLPFNETDLEALQRATAPASIAIHTAKRYADERAQSQRLAVLYRATTRLAASLDLSETLKTSVEALLEALGVSGCAILEIQGRDIVALTSHDLLTNAPFVPAGLRLPIQIPERLKMLEVGQWLEYHLDDPAPDSYVADMLSKWQVQSCLLIPLTLEQRLLGVVALLEGRARRRFTSADIELAQTVASQIGVAVWRAQLHSQVHSQRLNEQAALSKLARSLLDAEDRQQVADRAMKAISEIFRADHGAVFLTEGNAMRPYAWTGESPPRAIDLTPQNYKETGVAYVAHTREPVFIPNVEAETRFEGQVTPREPGMRSGAIAPIIYREHVLGVISVWRVEPDQFNEGDTRLLMLLAHQLAIALERARLFESVTDYANSLEAKVQVRTREIRTEQERTQAILEATGESLIVFDENGAIRQVNRAFEAQHGYKTEEVIGKSAAEILGVDLPSQVTRSQTALGGPTGNAGIWRGEVNITRCDGTRYDAAASLSPVADGAGRKIGIVASLRDITHLTELDRMKNEFVANVSHELRTPLVNIRLYLHLLENGLESRRDQYLTVLNRETDRLHNLIEDLLLLSRLDLRKIEPDLRPVDVNRVVRHLVEDRVAMADGRGLTLEYTLDSGKPVTLADERMLSHALMNLLANAMSYTPPGGQIRVSTQLEQSPSSSAIVISVADTGEGVPENEQPKVFDRFFRGAAARSTGSAGTGLGLSIVKEVMERHQGSVTLDSEPGQGATFTLRLPVRDIGAATPFWARSK